MRRSSAAARKSYDAHTGAVLGGVWQREGATLVFNPADQRVPLREVLDGPDLDELTPEQRETRWPRGHLEHLPSDLTELRFKTRMQLVEIIAELMAERDQHRHLTLQSILDYCYGDGPDILKVAERLFILARTASSEHVWNMRQADMARLFGQLRQNWQTIEEKLIEDLITRYSRTEFINSGGKSAGARANYKAGKKGNTSRKRGKRKGDEMPSDAERRQEAAAQEELPEMDAELSKFWAERAERERLAELCDCRPEDIDLEKTRPE